MRFHLFGKADHPPIVLLHGGGLSWWSWQPIVDGLQDQYRLIVPTLDGHDDDGDTTFRSIADSAAQCLAYLDANYGGSVYAIAGLSIGAQIVVEMLARRPKLARYAIIESALVYPLAGSGLMAALTPLFYGLIQNKRVARKQAQVLQIPDSLFERYYAASLRMTCQSLANITRSNGHFPLPASISETQANVRIVVGGAELGIMKRSASRLHEAIPGSTLRVFPGWKHGAASLAHPDLYLQMARTLWDSPAVSKA